MNVWKRKILTTVKVVGPRDDPMGVFQYSVEVNWDLFVLVISEVDVPRFWLNGLPIASGEEGIRLWELGTGLTRRMVRRSRRRITGKPKYSSLALLI